MGDSLALSFFSKFFSNRKGENAPLLPRTAQGQDNIDRTGRWQRQLSEKLSKLLEKLD
jgi:hypothetical protein